MRSRRHIPRLSVAVAGVVALAVAALCLSGCLGLSKKVTVAAQVGDIVISEEDVTAYIEGFRSQDDDRATDSGWALYLSANGYTAESFRQKVLDEVFIPEASVRIQAQAHNIVVTDEELDSVIEAEKAFYEESYGADSWTSVLASFGYDEKSWRESEMNRLLKERLADEVVGKPEPTQDQLMEYGPDIAPRFNGKHSYFAAFDTQEAGESALASLGGAGASIKFSAFKKMAELYAAAAELAAASDVMVVIGGRNSGNTRRLVEVCQASCPTYHVESAAELQPEWFAPHSRVGVTAGASTPQAHIDAVTAALEELA